MAKHLGFSSIVTETCTGDFGVACASFAALYDLGCRVYIRQKDAQRLPESRHPDAPDGRARRDLWNRPCEGAAAPETPPCATGARTTSPTSTGTSLLASPDPYPRIVAHALSWIGTEAKVQCDRAGITPEFVIAPVGSGGFAAGLFSPFLGSPATTCIGVQASGRPDPRRNASSLLTGRMWHLSMAPAPWSSKTRRANSLTPTAWPQASPRSAWVPQHAHWAQPTPTGHVRRDRRQRCRSHRRSPLAPGHMKAFPAPWRPPMAWPTRSSSARSLGTPGATIMVGLSGTGRHHPS